MSLFKAPLTVESESHFDSHTNDEGPLAKIE